MKASRTPAGCVKSIGVVVPANNEEVLIADCLASLSRAAAHPDLQAVPTTVKILVVLDDCADQTAGICARYSVPTVVATERNVGRARHLGAMEMVRQHRTEPLDQLWLAMTDADSVVAPDWLAQQKRLAESGADAVFGVVDVTDWSSYSENASRLFGDLYAGTAISEPGPHLHVHGACLGVRADVYLRVGGITGIPVGEDHALSAALEAAGANVARTTSVRVTTSARPHSRVTGGFASLLSSLETTERCIGQGSPPRPKPPARLVCQNRRWESNQSSAIGERR